MALARAGGFYKIVNLLWARRSFCLTRSTADPVSSLAWPGKEPRAGSSWDSGIHGFLSHSMGSTKLLLLLRTEEQKVHSSSTSRGRQQRVRAECPWAASPQPDTATADFSIARGSDCWQSSFGSSRTLLLSGTSRSLTSSTACLPSFLRPDGHQLDRDSASWSGPRTRPVGIPTARACPPPRCSLQTGCCPSLSVPSTSIRTSSLIAGCRTSWRD